MRAYYANLLIAISAAVLLLQSHSFLKIPGQPLWPALWLFAASFAYYGVHDWCTKVLHQPMDIFLPRAIFWRRHTRVMLMCIGASMVLALVSFWFAFTLYRLAMAALFSSIALVYTFPILPFKNLARFKEHAYLKLLALCTAWAGITTFGCLESGVQITVVTAWLFAVRFLFLLLISIPFDLRDTQHDARWMSRTLSERLGNKRIIRLLCITAALLTATLFAGIFLTPLSPLAAITAALHAGFCLWLSMRALRNPKKEKLFAWLDLQLMLHPVWLGIPWHLTYIRSLTI